MIVEIKVPSVGESISEGVLASWSVADGAYVEQGATLFELETDKASTEVAALASGVLKIAAPAGSEVKIGSTVGSIDTAASNGAGSAAPAKGAPAAKAEEEAAPRVLASSVAKKVAEENKVDLAAVKGTGSSGRITREDVEAVVKSRVAEPAPAKPAPAPAATKAAPAPAAVEGADFTRERMSMLRRRIAERLVEAQHTAAMLTTFNDVDMGAVMELRAKYKDSFKERHGVGLGFMSFFVKAAVEALKAYPRVNAMIDGNDVVLHHRQHIGVAVSTERGLVVPVLRNAERLTFSGVEKTIIDFAARARDGKLDIADMQGGTFTITNGGVFGSMLSTPILNPPQSAILGMHRIEDRPVARNGQVVIRPMMYLALSYDHRIIDGKEAVGFLVRIKECIENPARILLEI